MPTEIRATLSERKQGLVRKASLSRRMDPSGFGSYITGLKKKKHFILEKPLFLFELFHLIRLLGRKQIV